MSTDRQLSVISSDGLLILVELIRSFALHCGQFACETGTPSSSDLSRMASFSVEACSRMLAFSRLKSTNDAHVWLLRNFTNIYSICYDSYLKIPRKGRTSSALLTTGPISCTVNIDASWHDDKEYPKLYLLSYSAADAKPGKCTKTWTCHAR